jgi:cytoskeletal protein CcmA (bactofilin family)
MFDSNRFLRVVTWCALLVLTTGAVSLGAQELDDPEALRSAVESRYDVLPGRDGIVLRPREEATFETLEVGGGRLFLDGRSVTTAELSARIGRDETELVRNLVRLEPDELKVLFGFEQEVASELPPEAPEPPEAPLPLDLEERRQELAERARELAEQHERRAHEIEAEHRRIEEEIRSELEDKLRKVGDEEWKRRGRQRSDARVVFGSPVVVEADEITGEVVSIGGSVTVDGEVEGGAVAVGGPVRIQGVVRGDVVAVGGGVRLYSDARVSGDVVSVGGKLIREPGAEVLGEITEVSLWNGFLFPGWDGWDLRGRSRYDMFDGAFSELVGGLIRLAVLVLLGLVCLTVGRERFERIAAQGQAEPWRSGMIGFLSFVFFVPLVVVVVILLCISILGIPLLLLVPFGVLAFLLVALAGYLAIGYGLGRWLERRVERPGLAPFGALLVGLVLIHGWNILGDLIDLLDTGHDFAWPLVLLLGLFGFLVKLSSWSVGLGAALTSRFGARGPAGFVLPPAVPPPPPAGGRPSPDIETGASWEEGHPPGPETGETWLTSTGGVPEEPPFDDFDWDESQPAAGEGEEEGDEPSGG